MRGLTTSDTVAAPAGPGSTAPAAARGLTAPPGPSTGADRDPALAGEQASEEEQDQYNQIVSNAMKLMYDERSMPGTLKGLQGDGVPIEGLAVTAFNITKRVTDSARQNGIQISPDVLYQAGAEIVEELADLQKEAGIAALSQEQINGAFLRAVDMYRDVAQREGTLDQGTMAAEMNELVAADRQGTLDQLLPGASEAARRFQGRA